MASTNPLRYRGYYHDSETGFYYLQSRYYDPANHRFINADAPEYSTMSAYGLNNSNLFAYCGNNPVARADENGEFWNFIVGAVVGAVVSVVTTVVESAITGEDITFGDIAQAAVLGAAEGVLTTAFPGASTAISAGFSALDSVVNGVKDGDSVGKILVDATISAGFGMITGSSGNDFANTSLIDDGVRAIPKAFGKGVHPVVKKNAKKLFQSGMKYTKRALKNNLIEGNAYNLMKVGTKKTVELLYK